MPDSLELIFATPLLRFHHPNPHPLNADLWRDGLAWQHQSAGIQRSNQHGWHSPNDLFTRHEASFAHLRDWILSRCNKASKLLRPDFDPAQQQPISEAWANINGPSAFNAPHDHAGFHWSGVYYVRVPDAGSAESRSGNLELLDPRSCIAGHCLPATPGFAPKLRIIPKPGVLIVFPSYLRHWVYPNDQPEARMSIAFNLRYQPAA